MKRDEADQRLDPRTASVSYEFQDYSGVGDIGRVYYWFDRNSDLPGVEDHDLRPLYPDIDDETWQRLFCEAFHRAETEFEEQLLAALPKNMPFTNLMFHAGRNFGPRVPGAHMEQSIFRAHIDPSAVTDAVGDRLPECRRHLIERYWIHVSLLRSL